MILLKFPLAAPLLAFAMTVHAQDLILIEGNRTKVIETGKIISFKTNNSEGSFDKRNFASARGELIAVDHDSITLILFSESYRISEGKKLKSGELKNFPEDSIRFKKTFAKSTIKELAIWGDREEAIKNRKTWGTIGNLISAIGFAMPWFAGTTDDRDTRDRIMITGIAMLISGTVIVGIATPQIIKTSNDNRKNKNKKYWKIQ